MKKFWKRLCTIALAALACLSVILIPKSEKASAGTSAQSSVLVQAAPLYGQGDAYFDTPIRELPRTDNNFHFIQGCAVNVKPIYEGADPLTSLRFGLVLDNEDWVTVQDGDTVYATFTLYRDDGAGVKPLYRMLLFHAYNMVGVAHQHVAGDSEIRQYLGDINLNPSQEQGDIVLPYTQSGWDKTLEELESVYHHFKAVLVRDSLYDFYEKFMDIGFKMDFLAYRDEGETADQPILFRESNGKLTLNLDVTLNSPHADYFVAFEYEYRFGDDSEYGGVRSDTRSVAQVLEMAQAEGTLEEELHNDEELIEEAKRIIAAENGKEVVLVEYLEQIDKTTFAQKKTAEVTVPVNAGVIKYDDVAGQLGKDMHCMGAIVDSITLNKDRGIYECHYATSSMVYTKTTDGKGDEVPMDINKSFEGFYMPFVEDGIIEQEHYEYIWDSYLSQEENKALRDQFSDRQDEVYGLFGYVIIPGTHTISSLFADLFSVDAMYKGAFVGYTRTTSMSSKDYRQLLKDNGYNFWERLWSSVANWFTGEQKDATHYFFYADGYSSKVVISENGSTDINNTNDLLTIEMLQATQQMAETLGEAVNAVTGGKDSLFSKMGTLFKIAFGGIVVIVILFIAVKAWNLITSANAPKNRRR
ncbi:MAG: hypothetical protein IJV83_00035 [Clostridia bacterium]|nr:hypothetical protein [Clostridia bacterium]